MLEIDRLAKRIAELKEEIRDARKELAEAQADWAEATGWWQGATAKEEPRGKTHVTHTVGGRCDYCAVEGKACGAVENVQGYGCTRPRGHDGDHVACGWGPGPGDHNLCTWPQEAISQV